MTSFLSLLGQAMPAVYSLVGVVIGGWISRRSQHRQWVHDNKARDYRELVDAIDGFVRSVRAARPKQDTPFSEASPAVEQLSRVVRNKIFIRSSLRKASLEDKLSELMRYSLRDWGVLSDQAYTGEGLELRAGQLYNEILAAAERDLGLDS
jgi:hypothetical protein